ncbi:MAG: hypothetical protein KDE47_33250, partial [Caldilineaceae bacterium]|nr:hypothetical protein [Caldilineaceae bacterium]
FYQIWDEPNIAPHWGNHWIEPVAYAQLLKVGAQAIRSVDSDATIISAALAPTLDRGHTAIDELYYLQRLYAAGAAPYFDVLAIQPFGFADAPTTTHSGAARLNFDRAPLVHQVMVTANDAATPVWSVRYGWNRQHFSPWETVTEADQTRFAIDALTLARAQWPWLTAMAWVIDQPKAPPTDPSWGFALSEPLAEAFQAWGKGEHTKAQSTQRVATIGVATADQGLPWVAFGDWLVLLAGGWRMVLIGRQFPWAAWGKSYRRLPWWIQAVLWALLATLYHFAVWPPLLLLCRATAGLLLWWQPLVGLWLAAGLTPDYMQHKEFALGQLYFALAPSHMLLLCLVPAGVVRIKEACRGRTGKTVFQQLVDSLSLARFPTVGHLAFFWLLINLLSTINVWQWPAYQAGLLDLALLPLLGFALVRLLSRDECRETVCRLPTVMTALFVGGVVVALLGLIGWLRGEGTAADGVLRLVGPYFSPNQTAFYLERSLFLGLGLAHALSRYRHFVVAGLALILAALLLTASRGALLLGLPAGLLIWGAGLLGGKRASLAPSLRSPSVRLGSGWEHLRHRRRWVILGGSALCIVAIAALWLLLGD